MYDPATIAFCAGVLMASGQKTESKPVTFPDGKSVPAALIESPFGETSKKEPTTSEPAEKPGQKTSEDQAIDERLRLREDNLDLDQGSVD
jgi:hypothetical protein